MSHRPVCSFYVHSRLPSALLTLKIFALQNEKQKTFALRNMCNAAFRQNAGGSWYEFFLKGIAVCIAAVCQVRFLIHAPPLLSFSHVHARF